MRSVKILTVSILIAIFLSASYSISNASSYYLVQDKGVKTKFYNFDDLLIDGKIKKPQILYTDARQKVRFEKLLKLKKDFLPKLQETNKDPALK